MKVRSVDGTRIVDLIGWQVLPSAPSRYAHPTELPISGWLPGTAPGTVAGSAPDWEAEPNAQAAAQAPDEYDWWYRTTFRLPVPPGTATVLRLGGLATVADVWLNGRHLHHGMNMFLSHDIGIGDVVRHDADNALLIRFTALAPLLAKRRSRPRWRTRLVAEQNLRWYRTTLLGRIPSWSAGPAVVGPWQPIQLVVCTRMSVTGVRLLPRLDGDDGVVDVALTARPIAGGRVISARVLVAGESAPLTTSDHADGTAVLAGSVRLPAVRRWMPHTHGTPWQYRVRLVVELHDGPVTVDLGNTGFRDAGLAGEPSEFRLRFNDLDVFFRGACWTPLDPRTASATTAQYRRALSQLRAAGANMVRLCGPLYYEHDDFYDTCSELGIAVWQDFMFANLDYPFQDAVFELAARREVEQVIDRLAAQPCLALLCGNSEVSQQAAMLGLPPDVYSVGWFERDLRALCDARVPGVPYWPSSPSGGPLPMHPAAGDAHYQGVGAYLRDITDADTSGVRFASEALSFANVPEPAALRYLAGDERISVHDPRWKAGSPRDRGAGWDFDDVRDEYLRRLFRVDPLRIRYADPDRYAALARVVTGEVMSAVFGTWRGGDQCRGGLVWFWRDLVPGAGWGVLDWRGAPKAVFHYLRRAWQPIAVFLQDRGLNGLHAVVVNDPPATLDVILRIGCYPAGVSNPVIAERTLTVPGHGRYALAVEEVVGGFRDLNHAYRFGPVGHDVLLAELLRPGSNGDTVAYDVFFPAGLAADNTTDVGIAAVAAAGDRQDVTLSIVAQRPAQTVRVDVPGYLPDDNYFHLAPGQRRQIRLRPDGTAPARQGTVWPLNASAPTVVVLDAVHPSAPLEPTLTPTRM